MQPEDFAAFADKYTQCESGKRSDRLQFPRVVWKNNGNFRQYS